jgi:hypothetical protein
MGDGWLWVTAHRTGEQGMIFRDLVDDLDENIDPNTVFSWFHPNVTKSEAVDMLVKGNVKCSEVEYAQPKLTMSVTCTVLKHVSRLWQGNTSFGF